jgi:hypothetical protein
MDLEDQLAANREMWDALVELGAGEDRPLLADVFFDAPDQASALAVVDELIAGGDAAEATSRTTGVIRRRTVWSVAGQRTLAAPSRAALDDLVRVMADLAARHGAHFDGWGAQAP